jgi:hypothetical protein
MLIEKIEEKYQDVKNIYVLDVENDIKEKYVRKSRYWWFISAFMANETVALYGYDNNAIKNEILYVETKKKNFIAFIVNDETLATAKIKTIDGDTFHTNRGTLITNGKYAYKEA